MNKRMVSLKQQEKAISSEIRKLHTDKRKLINTMQLVCGHERVEDIDPDPFLSDIGIDDEETKVKCLDCYKYFPKNQRGGW